MKKTIAILVICFVCICLFASSAGSWGYGTVFIAVSDRYYRSIPWAYVAVDNSTCWNIGYGYYMLTTSIGWHCVYVSGVYRWVYVGWGHTWVSVCI